jgi:hypothetical protein
MYDLITILAVVSLGIALLVYVGKTLERRAKAQGPLFTQKPSSRNRIGAFIVGFLFGGIFLAELFFSNQYHFFFPIISVAAFAYAFGAYKLLYGIQKNTDEDQKPGVPKQPE